MVKLQSIKTARDAHALADLLEPYLDPTEFELANDQPGCATPDEMVSWVREIISELRGHRLIKEPRLTMAQWH